MEIVKLNIDTVVENKMSWLDCMKHYKPDITEDEANYILWNETCYPFDAKMTISQIHIFFVNKEKA